MSFLDLFFPKYCVSCRRIGSYICEQCFATLSFSQKQMCFLCGRYSFDGLTHPVCKSTYTFDGSFIGLEYTTVVKKLLYVFKYKPYVTDLQFILSDLLYESLIQKELLMNILASEGNRLLVPIPLHEKKLRVRGYNHAALLAKNLSQRMRIPYKELLFRDKETKIQAGLSKAQRKENIKDAFIVKGNSVVSHKTIILFDDIVTTGITFIEAAYVLKKNGAKKVYGIAFAGEN